MATCTKCGEKWTWVQSMRKIVKGRKRMTCNYCGEVQYQSKSSIIKMSLFSFFPIIVIPFNALFNLTLTVTLLIAIPLIILAFCMNVFLLELSNKEEPLW